MAKYKGRQAAQMKRMARKQWTGFWILMIFVISALVAALIYVLTMD